MFTKHKIAQESCSVVAGGGETAVLHMKSEIVYQSMETVVLLLPPKEKLYYTINIGTGN